MDDTAQRAVADFLSQWHVRELGEGTADQDLLTRPGSQDIVAGLQQAGIEVDHEDVKAVLLQMEKEGDISLTARAPGDDDQLNVKRVSISRLGADSTGGVPDEQPGG